MDSRTSPGGMSSNVEAPRVIRNGARRLGVKARDRLMTSSSSSAQRGSRT
jgi:hypothetical protein